MRVTAHGPAAEMWRTALLPVRARFSSSRRAALLPSLTPEVKPDIFLLITKSQRTPDRLPLPVIPLRAAALMRRPQLWAAVKRFRLLSNPVRVTTKQRRLSLRISILLLMSVPRPPLKHRPTVPIPSTVSLSQRTQPKRSPQR